jgi:hypothetical protein
MSLRINVVGHELPRLSDVPYHIRSRAGEIVAAGKGLKSGLNPAIRVGVADELKITIGDGSIQRISGALWRVRGESEWVPIGVDRVETVIRVRLEAEQIQRLK